MNSNDTCRRRHFCEFQKRFKSRIPVNWLILLSRDLYPLDSLLDVMLNNTLTSCIKYLLSEMCLVAAQPFDFEQMDFDKSQPRT